MTSSSHRWSPGSNRGEVKFILLLSWNWRVETMGEGDHESADSCRMGKVEGVGTKEPVYVGRLLRMGCDSFVMPVWICWKWGTWEQNRPPWEHSVENQWGRRGGYRKLNSAGGKGEAETESLILWLVKLELLAGGWWWREALSLIQDMLETYFVYLALRT